MKGTTFYNSVAGDPAAATVLTLPSGATGTLLSSVAATATVALGKMPNGSTPITLTAEADNTTNKTSIVVTKPTTARTVTIPDETGTTLLHNSGTVKTTVSKLNTDFSQLEHCFVIFLSVSIPVDSLRTNL